MAGFFCDLELEYVVINWIWLCCKNITDSKIFYEERSIQQPIFSADALAPYSFAGNRRPIISILKIERKENLFQICLLVFFERIGLPCNE